MTSSLKMDSDKVHVYYEVLNPEGDDIVHISHEYIISKKCKVKMLNITAQDIKGLQDSHRSEPVSSEISEVQDSSE